MNKRMKSSKGITLVALVVTIIVLLILAGVTVAMVLGSTGILGRAGQGREAQERAAIEEQIELGKTDAYMGERQGQEYFTTLRGYLTDNEVITSIATPVTAEPKGSSLILTVGEKYVYQITRDETTLLGDVASAYVPDVDLKEGIIEFTTTGYNYNNNTYARDSVGVRIAIGDSNYSSYSIEYKVGSTGTWTTYTASFNVTEETTVYARLANTISNTQTEEYYATEDITNIDKQAPSNVTFTIDADSVTDSEIKVTASATDDKGIAGYKFSATTDGTESWSAQQTSVEYTFTELDDDTEYTIKVQAIDVAERTTTSASQSQKTESSVTPVTYTIGSTTLTGTREASKVTELEASYGQNVTGYSATSDVQTALNAEDITWQLFYDDPKYVYLITSDYVPNMILPAYGNSVNGTSYNTTAGNLQKIDESVYAARFASGDDFDDYVCSPGTIYALGTESSAITNNLLTNTYLKWVKKYPDSKEVNMMMTAFMMDREKWNMFANNGITGTFAIGGPTLELYVSSWNAFPEHTADTGQFGTYSEINEENANSYGYNVKYGAMTRYGVSLSPLPPAESSMWYTYSGTKAIGYWISAPYSGNWKWLRAIQFTGNVVGLRPNMDSYGFRPVVAIPKDSIK